MYKSRKEIESLESLDAGAPIKYVIESCDKWKHVRATEALSRRVESYLTSINGNISKFLSRDQSNKGYQQAFEKNQKYLELLEPANEADLAVAISAVDKKVAGLIKNWNDTPTDQALPPVIEYSI